MDLDVNDFRKEWIALSIAAVVITPTLIDAWSNLANPKQDPINITPSENVINPSDPEIYKQILESTYNNYPTYQAEGFDNYFIVDKTFE
jgi:hypothetical protein